METYVALSLQMSCISASSGFVTTWPVGLRGLEVKMTEVPRAISSAILDG